MQAKLTGQMLAVLAVTASVAACGTTGRSADTRRGVTDAAYTPLRDVNMIRPEIPLLLRSLQYPYATVELTDCNAIINQIHNLDAVLGPESYQAGPNRNVWDRSGDFVEEQTIAAAQNTAQDLIPFRSWVRRLSGASEADREALRAVANGQQRRTFLRGYGASMGCPDIIPAPPTLPRAQQQHPPGQPRANDRTPKDDRSAPKPGDEAVTESH
ncbi:MAG: hypothetical protein HY054_06745 [Proteobacteria bacterium]|nr:hypothetical protein [Pseudomonadota bacterium]